MTKWFLRRPTVTLDHLFYNHILGPLPKKWLSHYMGALAQWKTPHKVNQQLIRSFAKYYKIDLEEAEKAVDNYQSLSEFFSRRLKEGARPIEGDIVHPCDGVLIESGQLHEDRLIQAKGKSFSLGEFIPNNPWHKDFVDGSFFTYYLAPQNYHRVHSPISGEVQWSCLVPGELWPVNAWSVKNIEGLYAVNERVATGLTTPNGRVIMVMVGATNVGSMSFSFDPNIHTNTPGKKEVVFRQYSDQRLLGTGDEFGTFHLGSTVVLLFEKSWGFDHLPRREVKMGQKFVKSH
jgi:phosphatidylserine decarboxylase